MQYLYSFWSVQAKHFNFIVILVCLLMVTSSYAQSDNGRFIPPIITLLFGSDDNDVCVRPINVGDTLFDTLEEQCMSAATPIPQFAAYFTFTHPGGPIHIDLLSDFPSPDFSSALLILRQGRGRTGTELFRDDQAHEDFRSAQYRDDALAAGTYTIEVSSANLSGDPAEGAYNLSLYGDRVTANATGRLNDTGVAFAGDSDTTNSAGCDGQNNFSNQDCNFGRDNDFVIGRVFTDNDGDGEDGFSFLKVSSTGAPLRAEDTSPHACVKDNVTGLMWEVKNLNTPADLHRGTHTYTWYNDNLNENGGENGTQDGGTCLAGVSCDTQGFVEAVNNVGLCGYSDWRIPSLSELLSLVNYQITNSQNNIIIDTDFFPFSIQGAFWSSQPDARDIMDAWIINFISGNVNNFRKSADFGVRLVRDGE